MQRRTYRDIIAGTTLIAFGLAVGLYAAAHYKIGTVGAMGPGMFPAALGYILAGLGLVVLVPALFRPGRLPRPEYRPFFAVLGGLLAFALTVDHVGMVPAIFLLTAGAVLAGDRWRRPVGTLALAAVLAGLAVIVFRVGLRMPIDAVKWPF